MFISSHGKSFSRVTQWLYEVTKELRIPMNVLYPSARLFYNYKSVTEVNSSNLQKEGAACLLISLSVHVDGYIEDIIRTLSDLSNGTFIPDELLATTEVIVRLLPEEIGRYNSAFYIEDWYYSMLVLSSVESWNYTEAFILKQIRLLKEGKCSYEFFKNAYESEQLYCEDYCKSRLLRPWIISSNQERGEKNTHKIILSSAEYKEESWRSGSYSIISRTRNSIVYKVKNGEKALVVKQNYKTSIAIREAVFFCILRHENIMSLLDFDLLKLRTVHPLGVDNYKLFTKEHINSLISAVTYLHEKGIVHRDIKPDNIVFVDGIPKLIDFGSMSYAGYGYSHEESTSRYLPPECLLSSKYIPYTKASDIWCLGVAILEYSMERYPFNCYEIPPTLEEIRRTLTTLNSQKKIPFVCQRMLELDPTKRSLVN